MFSWGEDSQGGFRLKDGSGTAAGDGVDFLNLGFDITDLSAGHSVLAFIKRDGNAFIIRTNESNDGRRVRGKQTLMTCINIRCVCLEFVKYKEKIEAVSCGDDVVTLLSETGRLLCVGSARPPFTPRPLEVLCNKPVSQVVCGSQHSVALTKDGQVYTWGQDSRGQLGLGKKKHGANSPQQLRSLSSIPLVQIAAGGEQSFALSVSGGVFSWGRNDCGQLGLGDTTDRHTPTPVHSLDMKKTIHISCGMDHTVILTKDGVVFTFGSGQHGQLGHNSFRNELHPRLVAELWGSKVIKTACGRHHTLVMTDSRRVYSFGCGEQGQLGRGEESHPSVPLPVQLPQDHDGWKYNSKITLMVYTCSWKEVHEESNSDTAQHCLDGLIDTWTSDHNSKSWKKTKQQIKKMFSSAFCMNQSFLDRRNDKHFQTSQKYSGLNLSVARLAFQKLAKKDDVWAEVEAAVTQLIPSLVEKPVGGEGLRIYLLLIELLRVMQKHKKQQSTNLAEAVAAAVVRLSADSLQANNRTPRCQKIPDKTFCLGINQEFLQEDLEFWRSMSKNKDMDQPLILCSFPFVMDLKSKKTAFDIDADLTKREHQQIFGWIPQINPHFFELKLKRASLLEGAFQQLAAADHTVLKKPLVVKTFSFDHALLQHGQVYCSYSYVYFDEDPKLTDVYKRDFFHHLFHDMVSANSGMFTFNDSKTLAWFPSNATDEDKTNFFLFGLLCGLALYNQSIVHLTFPLVLFKKLLDVEPSLDDMLQFSPSVGKKEFVDAYVNHVFNTSVEGVFQEFRRGFFQVCDQDTVKLFQPSELQGVLVGQDVYDWAKLKQNTVYEFGYHVSHPNILMFWEVFDDLTEDQKKDFLWFLTGFRRAPILGMDQIRMRIRVKQVQDSSLDQLFPESLTCHSILELPLYPSKEIMRDKLTEALMPERGFLNQVQTGSGHTVKQEPDCSHQTHSHSSTMFSWGEDSQGGFRLKDGSGTAAGDGVDFLNLGFDITDLSAGHSVLAFIKRDGNAFIIRTNESNDGRRVRGKQKFVKYKEKIEAVSCGDDAVTLLSETGRLLCVDTARPPFTPRFDINQINSPTSGSHAYTYSKCYFCVFLISTYSMCCLQKCKRFDRSLQEGSRASPSLSLEVCSAGAETTVDSSAWETLQDGVVFTFGSGQHGQLGHNSFRNELHPRLVAELWGSKVIKTACGRHHTLVMTDSRRVYSFGCGEQGQLGRGEESHPSVPLPVQLPQDHDGWKYNSKITLMLYTCSWKEVHEESNSDTAQHCLDGLIDTWTSDHNSKSLKKTKQNDKHFQTSQKYSGLNLSVARLAFQKLAKKDDVWAEVEAAVTQLILSLVEKPVGGEGLRIYLLLIELLRVMQKHKKQQSTNLAEAVAAAVVRLSADNLQVIGTVTCAPCAPVCPKFEALLRISSISAAPSAMDWWSSLSPSTMVEYVKVWKRTLSAILSAFPVPRNTGVKNLLLLLQYMYNANNRTPRCQKIPDKTFCLGINQEFLQEDLEFWRSMSKNKDMDQPLILCSFPFVMDLKSKKTAFDIDADLTKREHQQIFGWIPQINPHFFELKLKRASLLEGAFQQLAAADHTVLKKPLVVYFDEDPKLTDVYKRDFFHHLFHDMVSANSGMFTFNDSKTLAWFPSNATDEDKTNFFLFGLLCGLALYNQSIVHLTFPLVLFKKLLDVEPSLDDMLQFSPSVGKKEFVDAYVNHVFNTSVEGVFQEFRRGFFQVCDQDTVKLFQPSELQGVLVGQDVYDWAKLKQNTVYEFGYHVSHPNILMFWEVFDDLTEDQKKDFLWFLTGFRRAPILGMDQIRMRIRVKQVQDSSLDQLFPESLTCHSILELPLYPTKDIMRDKLTEALMPERGFLNQVQNGSGHTVKQEPDCLHQTHVSPNQSTSDSAPPQPHPNFSLFLCVSVCLLACIWSHSSTMFSWGEDSQGGFRLKDGSGTAAGDGVDFLNLGFDITDLSAGHSVLAFIKRDGNAFIIRTNESNDGRRVRGKQNHDGWKYNSKITLMLYTCSWKEVHEESNSDTAQHCLDGLIDKWTSDHNSKSWKKTKQNDKHFQTSQKYSGLNLSVARLAFQKLVKKDDVWAEVEAAVTQLIPSLVEKPVGVEGLRIYLLLIELLRVMQKHKKQQSTELTKVVAAAIVRLSADNLQVIVDWWSSLSPSTMVEYVKVWKRTLSAILSSFPVPRNTGVKNLLLVLQYMYNANNRTARCQKIPDKTFCFTINEGFLQEDLEFWRSVSKKKDVNQPLILCSFPFVMDLKSKKTVFDIDASLTKGQHQQIFGWIPQINPHCFELKLKRALLLEGAFKQLATADHTVLKKPLVVYFDEDPKLTDVYKRDFFHHLFHKMVSANSGMFTFNDSKTLAWFPSNATDEDKTNFFLFGLLCGLALYNQSIVHLPFPLVLFKKLLDVEPSLDDMLEFSPSVGKRLQHILDYEDDVVESLYIDFVIDWDGTEVDLDPQNPQKPLTSQNKKEFVDAYVNHVFNTSVEGVFQEFRRGFFQVCDQDTVKLFQPSELQGVLVGQDVYDWAKLKQNTVYEFGYHVSHPNILMFWEVFDDLTEDQKKDFLRFLTGFRRVPILGMDQIRMRIQDKQVQDSSLDQLFPESLTCHSILELPLYPTKEIMRDKLTQALMPERGFLE
ncbi:hypothetical protein PAMA_019007 [Pampus argenteus]